MARRIIICVIAIFIIGIGVSAIWRSFLPLLAAKEICSIGESLVGIILYLFTGWSLLRFNEIGRKLAIWMLVMYLIAILIPFVLILPPDSQFSIHPTIFGKPIFDSKNNYLLSIIFLFILLAINSVALLFLEQKETKKMFVKGPIGDSPEAGLESQTTVE